LKIAKPAKAAKAVDEGRHTSIFENKIGGRVSNCDAVLIYTYSQVVGSHTVLGVRPIVFDDSARDYHGTPTLFRAR